jgi:hypothetical protein
MTPISRTAKMIKRTISPVGRFLGGPEGCTGLTTDGSGAGGPDVAGGGHGGSQFILRPLSRGMDR